jgi:hypothetical protein
MANPISVELRFGGLSKLIDTLRTADKYSLMSFPCNTMNNLLSSPLRIADDGPGSGGSDF